MSFPDIKDPARRTALVDEYVKAMKTVVSGGSASVQTVFTPPL